MRDILVTSGPGFTDSILVHHWRRTQIDGPNDRKFHTTFGQADSKAHL